ncbi:hypothetical protein scyTo_0016490 [Scyliorhinus torazame]|uniref:RNA-binding protein 38 n=1 Tax=Scyliorhinus torazame TaxID=75743 RepID=A0A401PS17_SCYTO|nr:hypothetical protein [Scyliorhinus torazame]
MRSFKTETDNSSQSRNGTVTSMKLVTMADRVSADRACKDPNPIIDGRKANVNLAYLGAKPRTIQTGLALGIQQIHPALIQRPLG